MGAASHPEPSSPGQLRPASFRGRITLDPPGLFPLKLARLMLHEVKEVSAFAAQIEENTSAALHRAVARRDEDLALPRTLVAMEDLFGACPRGSDEWKCSFNFPLLLTANASASALRYIVVVADCRGTIDVLFYRIQNEPVPGPRRYHAPFDRELSRRQLDSFTDYLLRFLVERSAAVVPHIESFHRVVGSERIVYGKRGGRLFESWSKGEQEHEQLVGDLDRELAATALRQRRARLDAIVADAVGA